MISGDFLKRNRRSKSIKKRKKVEAATAANLTSIFMVTDPNLTTVLWYPVLTGISNETTAVLDGNCDIEWRMHK